MATQDEPMQAGSTEAEQPERIEGILVQIRNDLQARPDEGARRLLEQRVRDQKLDLSSEEFDALLARIDSGDEMVRPEETKHPD